MKRCNFFPIMIVAAFMLFGMTLSAQNYKSSTEAIKAVQGVISQNSGKSTTIVNSSSLGNHDTARGYQSTLDRPAKVRDFKVLYGKNLLKELNVGISVKDALNKSSEMLQNPAKARGELDIFQEVDTFFRNLLSK
ncbi:MAG TPA: hypothetical protein PK047_07730 [Saprospiraceae bacterium]|nr:hypothetical protein [Saprospiraceae bacterium]HRO08744.1 hypothetical protein [Saprospiraceae bacterium]HRP42055.1 hypothetical protein [Saprospiraceae bacterium]